MTLNVQLQAPGRRVLLSASRERAHVRLRVTARDAALRSACACGSACAA